MHAVTIEQGKLSWAWRPDPEPGEHELLVSVRCAGLNAADLLQQKGRYPAPPGVPADIPGLELAGEVVATGPKVTRFAEGDRVMAVVAGGAQAELAVVDERVAIGVPGGVDWSAAGGFPEAFSTAYDALFSQCGLSLGDRVLVTGAAGGVGTAAVQLAAASGARVLASVRRPELRDGVAALGNRAGGVIPPGSGSLPPGRGSATSPGASSMDAVVALDPADALATGPFDVVLELVGAPGLPAAIDALASGGRVCVIGVGAGAKVELNLLSIMAKRARLCGSTLRARPLLEKAAVAAAVEAHAVAPFAAGRLSVPLVAEYAMADAAAAYERFAEPGKLGKLVLRSG